MPASFLFRSAMTLALAAIALPVFAADPPAPTQAQAQLPAWEQLTPAQRETLIGPVRERWNTQPEERQRMLDRAQRWQQMTPEQRKRARHGMQRWEHMNPEQRDQARALFAKMRTLDEPQRKALKAQWRSMTPDQRREWVKANPAPADMPHGPPPGPPPRD